jgi:hypothetical protein
MTSRTTPCRTRHPPSDPDNAFCHPPTLMASRTTPGQTRHPPSDPDHAFCHPPPLMTSRTTAGQTRHPPSDPDHAFCHPPTLMTSRTTAGQTQSLVVCSLPLAQFASTGHTPSRFLPPSLLCWARCLFVPGFCHARMDSGIIPLRKVEAILL